MDILKVCAEQRGVTGFSLGEHVSPLSIALDEDQLLPLLVLAAEVSLNNSGMFEGVVNMMEGSVFPWGVDQVDSDEALLNGAVVAQNYGSPIDKSVALLFLDREVEALVADEMAFDPATGIVKLDGLLDSLEQSENISQGLGHEQNFSFG